MNKVLVTGGCGYIGSHTIVDLINNGFEVICVDSLVNSDLKPLKGIEEITGKKVQHYTLDLCDRAGTRAIFEAHPGIVGVIHFAALKSVGESVFKPLWYYDNNLNSLMSVLHCLKAYNVNNFIFSSSCSVYGNAKMLPVTENTPMEQAESPYAATKQIGEQIIRDFAKTNPAVQSILLRYFNPAGAHPSALIGESPINKANNLVPVITETAIGRREKMMVFGVDYDTRDGSCIRDYIHVMDLAHAHTKALQYALKKADSENCGVYNLGIGEGVTVLEAIKAFEKVSGLKLNYELGDRRAGDVVAIYANFKKAAEDLGWMPKHSIEDIMLTAWDWEKRRSAVMFKS